MLIIHLTYFLPEEYYKAWPRKLVVGAWSYCSPATMKNKNKHTTNATYIKPPRNNVKHRRVHRWRLTRNPMVETISTLASD